MVKITISNLNNLTLEHNDNTKSVLSILQENHTDWMHACGAKGRCTTCKMTVLKGMENLSSISEAEQKFSNLNRLDLNNERLTCQSRIEKGSVEIKVPEESKLPHIVYST